MFAAVYPSGPYGFWVFLLVTLVLGGLSAWATGRAIALTWRPYLQLVGYTFLLACAVRFLQYALFEQPLLSSSAFAIDFIILLLLSFVGYRMTRAGQMTAQYPWAYQRAGAIGWRDVSGAGNPIDD